MKHLPPQISTLLENTLKTFEQRLTHFTTCWHIDGTDNNVDERQLFYSRSYQQLVPLRAEPSPEKVEKIVNELLKQDRKYEEYLAAQPLDRKKTIKLWDDLQIPIEYFQGRLDKLPDVLEEYRPFLEMAIQQLYALRAETYGPKRGAAVDRLYDLCGNIDVRYTAIKKEDAVKALALEKQREEREAEVKKEHDAKVLERSRELEELQKKSDEEWVKAKVVVPKVSVVPEQKKSGIEVKVDWKKLAIWGVTLAIVTPVFAVYGWVVGLIVGLAVALLAGVLTFACSFVADKAKQVMVKKENGQTHGKVAEAMKERPGRDLGCVVGVTGEKEVVGVVAPIVNVPACEPEPVSSSHQLKR